LKLVLIIAMAVVVFGISVSLISVQGQQNNVIPQWIKNNAGWWADDSIDDESFVNGIKYLIDSGIMEINIDTTIQDQGDFYLTYNPNPNSPYVEEDSAIAFLKNSNLLEREINFLNENFRLPYDVEVLAQECGNANAWYDYEIKQIVICYELIDMDYEHYIYYHNEDLDFAYETVDPYIYDNLDWTFFHEVGHALIDVYQLPITGLEENVADQFASLMLSYTYDENTGDYSIGQDMLYNVGTWFWISNELYSVNPDDYPFWDTHNLDIQRFYNISCYAYGSDPQYNQDLIDEGYLPEDRAYWCEEEYLVMERAWSFLLKDFDNGFFD
jgi:hypothetical protein